MLRESEARKLNIVEASMLDISYVYCVGTIYQGTRLFLFSCTQHMSSIFTGTEWFLELTPSARIQRKEKGQKVFPEVPPNSSHICLTGIPSLQSAWEREALGHLITTGVKLETNY